MYINRKDALEILGKLSREPYYQHDGEDYYVGLADASGEIYAMPGVEINDVMDYKAMWGELKTKIESDLKYYEDGTMCSMIESVHGTQNCEAMLKEMKALEEKYGN